MNDNILFRAPTDYEIKKISYALSISNKKHIKRNNLIATIFAVLSGFAILSIDFSKIGDSLFSLFLLIVSLACTFMFVSLKKTSQKEIMIFEDGSFKVLDGYISKTSPNLETNGCVNVWFESDTYSNGWYKVRIENVEIGTKAILVKPDVQLTKRLQCYVFTPFMLSDEGVKLHW